MLKASHLLTCFVFETYVGNAELIKIVEFEKLILYSAISIRCVLRHLI
jgi:hypothetical protein